MRPQRHGVGKLIIEHEYVERHVHTHAMGMGHGTTARELIIVKAMRAHSSVESVQPRIDGIGTRRNRREHLVEAPAVRAAPLQPPPTRFRIVRSIPSPKSPSANSLPRYAITLLIAVNQHTRGLARPDWFIV